MKFPALALATAFITLTAQAAEPTPAKPAAPLEAVKQKYVESAKQVEENIRTLRENSPSCGFIGGMLASKVDGVDHATAESRKEIEAMLSAADKANPKKKAQMVERISAEIASVNDAKQEVEKNLSTIKDGLTGESPQCKAARKAFFASQSSSQAMLQQLEAARAALSGKQARLYVAQPERDYAANESQASFEMASLVMPEDSQEASYESGSADLQ